jgi:uncharacterized protein (DUF1697 family)
MQRYVALLRAINVGGRTVKMEELRAHFAAMGFTGVETFIASGNVLFDVTGEEASEAIERRIEEGLLAALGYRSEAFVRSSEEMAVAAEREPFPAEDLALDGSALYVLFVQRPLSGEARERVAALNSGNDKLSVCDREVYWWCRGRMSESTLFSGPALGKAIGVPATSRNITTVRKLAAKLA